MKKLTYAVLVKALCVTGVMVSVPVVTTAYAAPASEEVAAKNLNKLLTNIQSMTADFNQTTKVGGKDTVLSGKATLQRQNQFRWETKAPAEQLIVANGSTLWIYDKDLQQATKQTVANQVGDTPALLLSGDPSQINKSFFVSQPNASKNYYVLTPKTATNFKDLSLSFNGGKPVMVVLNDAVGQTTVIKFSNISMNKKIAASQFSFTPPAGVDIINQ